jgi:hypothetical protein
MVIINCIADHVKVLFVTIISTAMPGSNQRRMKEKNKMINHGTRGMESPTSRGILTVGRKITVRLDKAFVGDIHRGNVLALDGLRRCYYFG